MFVLKTFGDSGSFHTDPSGTFMKHDAKAIGSGSEAAQAELQDQYKKVRPLLCSLLCRSATDIFSLLALSART